MRTWEKNVRTVVPYTPGEQPKFVDVIKLNTNENPYPPSPKVKECLEKMNTEAFRLYPEPACDTLVDALAETYHMDRDEIFVGVGSDDVLAMCFLPFSIPESRSFSRISPIPSTMSGQMCSGFRMSVSRWIRISGL